MKEGEEPVAGEIIYLRNKRKDMPKLREALEPKDSLMDNTVYADAQKNIETSQPQLPHNPYDLEAHGIKEQMAFIHIVQAGETLFAIAKRYNIQLEGVKELNKLKGDAIHVGMHLIINPNQPTININEESVIPGYHTVLQGETLYSIARLYRTTVEMLKTLNELQSDTIKVGEELVIIPKFEEKPAEQKVTDDEEGPVYYEVREGETLYAISRKFQTEIAELRKLNNMIDNTIHVGQKLRVR
jgi:LysM repeat protein